MIYKTIDLGDLQGYENLNTFSLRTSGDCLHMIEDQLADRRSSEVYGNMGMMINGNCLTLKISEFYKSENYLTLSKILERNPCDKYFLSEEQQAALLSQL